jgi:superfamily I DNA/RNA helicase
LFGFTLNSQQIFRSTQDDENFKIKINLYFIMTDDSQYSQNQKAGLGTRSLFVVGDDAQSIYAFRGSKIEIILNFQKQYQKTTEIILNQNYRSNQQILDLAEKVLTHNSNQKKKALFTDRQDPTTIKYYTARNEKDEAEFIIRTIYDLYGKETKLDSVDSVDSVEAKPTLDPDKERVKAEFAIENLMEL